MRRVLVTGANGQVGRSILKFLAKEFEVIPWGRLDFDPTDSSVTFDTLRDLVIDASPYAIINAAAWTNVDAAERQEYEAALVNARLPEWLALICVDQGIQFIHFSTDYVFSGNGSASWLETDQTNPLNAYGRTKCNGETLVLNAFADSKVPHYLLRTSWVYSEYGNNFVKTMLRLGQERDSLSVVADQIGTPTSAVFLADIAASLLKNCPTSGLYHVTASGDTSWFELASYVLKKAHELGLHMKVDPKAISPLTSDQYPTLALRPLNSRLNTDKLQAALGITMPPWQRGVDDVVKALVKKIKIDRSLNS